MRLDLLFLQSAAKTQFSISCPSAKILKGFFDSTFTTQISLVERVSDSISLPLLLVLSMQSGNLELSLRSMASGRTHTHSTFMHKTANAAFLENFSPHMWRKTLLSLLTNKCAFLSPPFFPVGGIKTRYKSHADFLFPSFRTDGKDKNRRLFIPFVGLSFHRIWILCLLSLVPIKSRVWGWKTPTDPPTDPTRRCKGTFFCFLLVKTPSVGRSVDVPLGLISKISMGCTRHNARSINGRSFESL